MLEILDDLDLHAVAIVHAGSRRFSLAPRVEAIPAALALDGHTLADLAADAHG